MSHIKHRIIAAVVGIPTLAVGTFVAGGLGFWMCYVAQYGTRLAPDMFGWEGTFILGGLAVLIAAAPSLLAFLTLCIIWRVSLAWLCFLSMILSLVLSFTSSVLIWWMMSVYPLGNLIPYLSVAGAACLIIVALVVMVMKWKWCPHRFAHD